MTAIITTNLASDIISGTLGAVGDFIPVASLGSFQTVGFQITGTFVGTVVFEGTIDGVTWGTVGALGLTGSSVASLTAAGQALVPAGGLQAIRARCSAYTSGTINVTAIGNGGWLQGTATQAVTFSNVAVSMVPSSASSGMSQLTSAIAPATPTSTAIKASAGRLYRLSVSNTGASGVWVKVFNATSITVGTTATPVINMFCAAGQAVSWEIPSIGDYFSTGISYYVSGAIALNDATAITANTVGVSVRYA